MVVDTEEVGVLHIKILVEPSNPNGGSGGGAANDQPTGGSGGTYGNPGGGGASVSNYGGGGGVVPVVLDKMVQQHRVDMVV